VSLRGLAPGFEQFMRALGGNPLQSAAPGIQAGVSGAANVMLSQQQAAAKAKADAARMAFDTQQGELNRAAELERAHVSRGDKKVDVMRPETPDEHRARITNEGAAQSAPGQAALMARNLPLFAPLADAKPLVEEANKQLLGRYPVGETPSGEKTWVRKEDLAAPKTDYKVGYAHELLGKAIDDFKPQHIGTDQWWAVVGPTLGQNGGDVNAARIALQDKEVARGLDKAFRHAAAQIGAAVKGGVVPPQEAFTLLETIAKQKDQLYAQHPDLGGGGASSPASSPAAPPTTASQAGVAQRAAALDDNDPAVQAALAERAAPAAAPPAAAPPQQPQAPQDTGALDARPESMIARLLGLQTQPFVPVQEDGGPLARPPEGPTDGIPASLRAPPPPVTGPKIGVGPGMNTSYTTSPSEGDAIKGMMAKLAAFAPDVEPPAPPAAAPLTTIAAAPSGEAEAPPPMIAAPPPAPTPSASRPGTMGASLEAGLAKLGTLVSDGVSSLMNQPAEARGYGRGADGPPGPPLTQRPPPPPTTTTTTTTPGAVQQPGSPEAARAQGVTIEGLPPPRERWNWEAIFPGDPNNPSPKGAGEPPMEDLLAMPGQDNVLVNVDTARVLNRAAMGASDEIARIIMNPTSGYRDPKRNRDASAGGGPSGGDNSRHRTGDAVDLPTHRKLFDEKGRFKGWKQVVSNEVMQEVRERMEAAGFLWLGPADPVHYSIDGR
jgi:hypothetical protein